MLPQRRQPLWSILIPTLDSRQAAFLRLAEGLGEQLARWHARGEPQLACAQIELTLLRNNGEQPVGVYRQRLLDSAAGRYVSFIDDDDQVSGDYVEELAMILVQHGPQIVSFPMTYTERPPRGSGLPERHRPVNLSLEYDGWDSDEPHGEIRCDLTIVQPIRTDLARLGRFDGPMPEDRYWRAQVRPHLDLPGQVYLPRPMYRYIHDQTDTVQGALRTLPTSLAEPYIGPAEPYARWVE